MYYISFIWDIDYFHLSDCEYYCYKHCVQIAVGVLQDPCFLDAPLLILACSRVQTGLEARTLQLYSVRLLCRAVGKRSGRIRQDFVPWGFLMDRRSCPVLPPHRWAPVGISDFLSNQPPQHPWTPVSFWTFFTSWPSFSLRSALHRKGGREAFVFYQRSCCTLFPRAWNTS